MNREINYRIMSLAECKNWANEIDHYNDADFASLKRKWASHSIELKLNDPFYSDLRKTLVDAFDNAGGINLTSKNMYPIDMEVGLAVYEFLSTRGFTEVEAANVGIWRYISVTVIPDLTYFRYPDPEKSIREAGGKIGRKRFFLAKRRIWISTLWWYVHLSWQGSCEATRAVIRENGSNIISKFIETPGRGYRIELYRSLMKKYSETDGKNSELFNSMAKLNGAECRNIEPELLPGGVSEYCDYLFAKLKKSEESQ